MKIPKNNLFECLNRFIDNKNNVSNSLKTNQLITNQINSNNSLEIASLTSTPINNNYNNSNNDLNRNFNKSQNIERNFEINGNQLSTDLSPIIRQNKCRKRIVIEESDEELNSSNKENDSNRSDKSSIDYFLNNRLLLTDCPLEEQDIKELKELNYQLMTQICDRIESCSQNDINDLKHLLEARKKIINRMSGSQQSVIPPIESRCVSPVLIDEDFDYEIDCPFDNQVINDVENKEVIDLNETHFDNKVRELNKNAFSEVIDLSDDSNHSVINYNRIGDKTPSICSIENEVNVCYNQTNSDDIAIIDDLDFSEDFKEDDFNDCQVIANQNNINCFNDNVLEESIEEKIIEYDFNKSSDNFNELLNTSIEGHFVGLFKNNGMDPELKRNDFIHSSQMNSLFKNFFKLENYRYNQFEAMNAALLNYDCLILMPTGGGKSICYQLPAMMSKGVTIVISPLKSLIQDQIQKMCSKREGVAQSLTSDLDASAVSRIISDLKSAKPKIKILFVTPEKVSASNALINVFNDLNERQLLTRFAIDEAHCVSQWGHDFRPDYQKLSILKRQYPNVPIMALTATATQRVRLDILNQLGIEKPSTKWFMQSFNRTNLKFEVRIKSKNSYDEILLMLQTDFQNESGIIYCLSRKDCDKLSVQLHKDGIKSIPYHAGMKDDQRKQIQEKWINKEYDVICATIAFGMGIDKPDVRFVIHYSMPKSIEGYFQEVGRAGRDGKVSHCILYYNGNDLVRWKKLLLMSSSNEEKFKVSLNYLYQTEHYCSNRAECRRAQLLRYFGEVFDPKKCIENIRTVCDNCISKDEYENVDITDEVVSILKSVELLVGPSGQRSRKQNIGFPLLTNIFYGNDKSGDKFTQLPMFGKGSRFLRTDNERLFKTLIRDKYLNEDTIFNKNKSFVAVSYARLGEKAYDVLLNGKRFIFPIVKKKSGSNSNYFNELEMGSTSSNKRSYPWNAKIPTNFKRTANRNTKSKSKYFNSQKSKPASSYGFKAGQFISVPPKKPKRPQL